MRDFSKGMDMMEEENGGSGGVMGSECGVAR